MAVIFVIACGGGGNPSAPVAPADPNAGVRHAAQQFAIKLVTPRLKAPATADFPKDSIAFERMETLKDDKGETLRRWLVQGGVDAENSFGAKLRSRWTMILGNSGDSFYPLVVEFEGAEIFRLPSYSSVVAQAEIVKQSSKKQEKREREVATDRDDGRAAPKSDEKPKPELSPEEQAAMNEKQAGSVLEQAKALRRKDRDSAADRRLREIVEKFPGTKAAAEAEKLLAR
ncbi:MAG: hypothetical protein ACT4QC_08460 [Planctomycetaceae bacterium]